MLFTHDTEYALGTMVELVNTGPGACGEERLADLGALRDFVDRNRISDVRDLSEADLTAVRRLRSLFHDLFGAEDKTQAVALVNVILKDVRATPHLTDHDGHDWHMHFFAPGARVAEHIAADCAVAVAYVVAGDELDRLRTCEAPDCTRVLVDLSRNRCRRYCDSRTCGNRMHVAAYRARQRESAR